MDNSSKKIHSRRRVTPNFKDIKKVKNKHNNNATFAIWLGILLDSIPESLIIGISFLTMIQNKGQNIEFSHIIPYMLIFGLFLSNLPESLSSSIGMKQQGLSIKKYFTSGGTIVLITAIGSSIGYVISDVIPKYLCFIFLQGSAAGSMLTMIASAFFPEAIHLSDEDNTGLSTLIGFLSILLCKLFRINKFIVYLQFQFSIV